MYCRQCGVKLQQGMLICPECGTRQRRRASSVRCASCHARVSIDLTVCPRCGHNVRPAGPRWGLWAASALTIGLLSLWGLGQLPVEGFYREVVRTRDRLVSLAEIPDLSRNAPLVIDEEPVVPARPVATLSVQAAPETFEPAVPESGIGATDQSNPPPADSAAPEPATPAPVLTDTPVPMDTATATSEPSPTATAAPTDTPAPTATEPGAVTRYKVRAGDTLGGIGARLGVSWQSIAAANGLRSSSILRVGQELIIPGVGGPLMSPTPVP